MILTFTFSVNQETNEAAFAGNIGIQQALQLLQQLAIADAVNKARKEGHVAKLDKDSQSAIMTDAPGKE